MTPHDELTTALGRPPESLRVWLVHDWLTGMRGGEKVLLQLVKLFPQAKITTLFYVPGSIDPEIEKRIAATSFLQRVPRIGHVYRHLLPIMPDAIRGIPISNCDLVISTSHCVAKGIAVPRNVPHLCYCFTPMRYVWETADHYFADQGGLAKRVAGAAIGPLRDIDLQFNEGVTRFATTCHNVAQRIQRCYGRDAEVIYPGLDDIYIHPAQNSSPQPDGDYYLVVSALVPYKRVDLAIKIFAADRSRKLIVIGKGPREKELKALAGDALDKTITFLGWQDEVAVRSHYARCRALIFPGEEDFGLVPLEVQACGRPVIAYGAGGVLETVKPLGSCAVPTGVFFQQQTSEALAAAVQQFESNESQFDHAHLRANAQHFTWEQFERGVCSLVGKMLTAR